MRRAASGSVGSCLWALATVAVVAVGLCPPAFADTGGGGGGGMGARVAVTRTHVEPDGAGSWVVNVHLANEMSGADLTGMEVRASGTGPQGAVLAPNTLFKEMGGGRYQGQVPGPAGPWSVDLVVREVPGNGVIVFPYSGTVKFSTGGAGGDQLAAGTSGAAPSDKGGGGGGGALTGVLLAVVAVGVLGFAGLRAKKIYRLREST